MSRPKEILVIETPGPTDGRGLEFPLDELPVIKTQSRKKQAKKSIHPSQICGADTETKNGRVWLWSSEYGVWEVPSFAHFMSILYSNIHSRLWRTQKKGGVKRGRVVKQFFYYNLKFDAQAIIKLLPDEVMKDLTQSKTDEGEIGTNKIRINADTGTYAPDVPGRMVEIKYLEGKCLEIRPEKWMRGDVKLGPSYHWDISQFYNRMRLNKASQIYLGETKIEKCFDGTILDASRFDDDEYTDFYREDIEEYAVQDAILAGKLARRKREEFVQVGVRFIRPFSLANVAQRNLLDTCTIPTVNKYTRNDRSRFILRAAKSSYRGGWFETLGSGYHASVVCVDLASAYPYIMYHLPNLDHLSEDHADAWMIGDGGPEFLEWMEENPMGVGFCEAFFLFEEGHEWYPLVRMADSGTLVTPRMVRGWFTTQEVREALKWPVKQFELGRWCYFSDTTQDRPFRPFIAKFYRMKNESQKGSAEYAVSKVQLNSIYGKTIQAVNDKAGTLWNPMYASITTGATRARLAELIRLNDYQALAVATDGVIFPQGSLTNIPNRPLPGPYNLGQWEMEDEGELVMLMSGVYSIRGADYTKTVFRGSASYFLRPYREEGLFGFCTDNQGDEWKSAEVRRPYSAGEARMRGDMQLMNVFAPHTYTIRPAGDTTKRLWTLNNSPRYFGDLLSQWWTSHPHERV